MEDFNFLGCCWNRMCKGLYTAFWNKNYVWEKFRIFIVMCTVKQVTLYNEIVILLGPPSTKLEMSKQNHRK